MPITPVIAPDRSTRTRHESIHVVVSFFGLKSGSNAELPPHGSRQVEMPMPASRPRRARRSRAATQRRVVDRRERLVEHGVVVARVVGRAARDAVGELVLADEVPPAQLDAVHAEMARDAIHRALEREVGRRLAEAAHRFLRRLVGHHRDRLVLDRRRCGTARRSRRPACRAGTASARRRRRHRRARGSSARGWCRRRRTRPPRRRCGRGPACRRRACSPAGPR